MSAPIAARAATADPDGQAASGAGKGSLISIPLPAPGDDAWQPIRFDNIDTPTEYTVTKDPAGRPAFRATTRCGASGMRLALPEALDLEATPRLAWRWRIERGLDNPGEKEKAGDDFAARVYVLYAFDEAQATLYDRIERGLGQRLFGVDMPGKTINYVWASHAETGAPWISAYHRDVQLVPLATGSAAAAKTSTWTEASVELQPSGLNRPYALGLMVDADNTCTDAAAWFSDFRLLGPDAPKPAP